MTRSVRSKRLAAAVAVMALAALAGARTAEPGEPSPAFLGVVGPPAQPPFPPQYLACLDPRTLQPTSGRLEIGEFHDAFSLSPDGGKVALGLSKNADPEIAGPGVGRVGVQIVDLARLEPVRDVHTGIAAEAVAWLSPNRLVALLQDGLTVIDPGPGAVIRRWSGWSGRDGVWARTHNRFVVVAPGARGALLGTLNRRAELRSARLRRIRDARPRVLADPKRDRAYVFSQSGSVANVDLKTMGVTYRRLVPASFPAKPRPTRSKPLEAPQPTRGALWVGNGLGAVLGPVRGVTLVDTLRWRAYKLDRQARAVAIAGGRILAYGLEGIRGYGVTGRKLFDVLRGQRVRYVVPTVGRAYVATATALLALDTRTARFTRLTATAPEELLAMSPSCGPR